MLTLADKIHVVLDAVFHRSPPAGGAGGEFPRLDFIGRIPPHLDSPPGVGIPRLASASPPGRGGNSPPGRGNSPPGSGEVKSLPA